MRGSLPSRQQGVSLVEFIVIFPVAVLVVLSIIQLGMIYIAKNNLNHATFMAARRGAVQNASVNAMRESLTRGLIPHYQNSFETNVFQRLINARLRATLDMPLNLSVDRLSPSAQAFNDFGIVINGQRQIPNDSLAYRNDQVRANSGVNIQDANLLKIRVTYGFELKVPLMRTIVRTVMCSGSALRGFGGNVSFFQALDLGDCLRYYQQGRVPIVSYAVVQMQSPAFP